MPSKEGWTHERDHDKVTLGKKQYRNMEEWSRPCALCGNPFSIFVRTGAGELNSSFGLRTCKDHRGQKIPGGSVTDGPEIEALRMSNAVMKQELDGAYAQAKTLFEENQVLKARLARYELQGAIQEHATNSEPASNLTFPWS